MDKSTITCTAGHDIKAGDLVYINPVRRNLIQKIIFWLMFWKKDMVYTVTNVDPGSSFTIALTGLVTMDKYCGDCINIVACPIGYYCKITRKNLETDSLYYHDKKDAGLLRHCIDNYRICDCEPFQSCNKCKQ